MWDSHTLAAVWLSVKGGGKMGMVTLLDGSPAPVMQVSESLRKQLALHTEATAHGKIDINSYNSDTAAFSGSPYRYSGVSFGETSFQDAVNVGCCQRSQ